MARQTAPSTPHTGQPPAHADVLSSAKQLEQLERLPEARRAYEAVLVKYPQHVECLHRLGVVCTRQSDFEAARAHYERALAISPENAPVLTDAGYARYLAGDYRLAEQLLRKSIAISPDEPRTINNLAIIVGITGRFDESLQLFQKSNPPAKAWTNLGYVYQLRREPDQALICYQRARAIDSSILIPEELLAHAKKLDATIAQAELPPPPVKPQPVPAKPKPAVAPPQLAQTQAKPAQIPSQPVQFKPPAVAVASAPPVRSGESSGYPAKPIVEPMRFPVVHADAKVAPAQPRPSGAPPKDIASAAPTTASETVRTPSVQFAPKSEPLPVADQQNSTPTNRAVPAWASEEPQPRPPSTASIIIAPRFEPPTSAAEEAPVATSSTEAPELEDPFQLPLVAEPTPASTPEIAETVLAPELEIEPALSQADDIPEQPLAFAEPSDPSTDHAFDDADLAWLATQKTKLIKRTNWEGTKGFCLVALLEERRLAECRDEFSAEYQSQAYHFSSADALGLFQAHPEKYAPVAGGLDIIAVRTGSGVMAGSLDFAVWYRDRLYLFSSPEHKDQFRSNPQLFVKQ